MSSDGFSRSFSLYYKLNHGKMLFQRVYERDNMDSKFLDCSLSSFLNDLGSDLPAPGGGAVSGLSGALGAALGRMVASLTLGRKKYESFAGDAALAAEQLAKMIPAFMDLSERDAKAYSGYIQAASMPKNTEQEIAARREAMQKAIRNSADVPFQTLVCCRKALVLLESLYGRSNITCVGDLAAGAMELSCAAQTAWLNILANLPYFSSREDAKALLCEARDLLLYVTENASSLYQRIETDLRKKYQDQI